MGKRREKKSSKGRLDKYYHLAKEQGYRARSAFKLIQLNKKYEFLERARVLIDLCAAPGGWLQVAAKQMPTSSMIIGVDLAAIKPIPNVITFQDDITTDKCRQNLRQQMKTWKADVVLHDGAPNVGTAWTQDAFSQSELVLMSLKLATEFLTKGGTFVTKVFRSKDYNKLLWVFQQLFRKVEATKPASSRNVSAEIFVVCREYLAPKKIDPRFLDAKAVFSELDQNAPARTLDIFKPEKKKRQREGYEEGNYTLHKKVDAMDFIRSQDPIAFLGSYNQLAFETDEARELRNKPFTTEDIKVNCDDLKVLGKRDFKELLRWREAARKEYKIENEAKEEKPVVVETEPLDEDEQLEAELENLSKEEAARRKRERRKANEKKMRAIYKMQMNMTTPSDIGADQTGADGETLFNIKKIGKENALKDLDENANELADQLAEDEEDEDIVTEQNLIPRKYRFQEMDAMVSDDDDDDDQDSDASVDELEAQLNEEYQRYLDRRMERDPKLRAKLNRQQQDDWHGFDKKHDDESDSDSDDETDDDDAMSNDEDEDESDSDVDVRGEHSLLNDLGEKKALLQKTNTGLTKGAAMFFDQDLFKGAGLDDLLGEEDDDESEDEEQKEEGEGESDAEMQEQPAVVSRKRKAEEDLEDVSNESSAEEDSDFEVVDPKQGLPSDDEMWDGKEDANSKAVKKARETGLITPEAYTLAKQLANKEKSKQDLIDSGFTKEAFRDKNDLPEWFLHDENRHNKPNLPVTKEAMKALREKLKALDARPIKKIAEAKARKKHKAAKRMQKAQQKANDIADNPDLTEKEKVQTINRIISRAGKSKPKKEVKLVVAKGSNRGIKGRPTGVKGRYKMVDRRMKKEIRAEKRRAKKGKK